MQDSKKIIENCKVLLEAFKSGKLGQTRMPEDSNPRFKDDEMELRFAYFSLPMALNYQRNSYTLWESALKTYQDEEIKNKKGFPYLSGPKIFNYWSFILKEYGKTQLKNVEFIEIAPDTHVTQCSVKLGVITEKEAETLSKDAISNRWREVLKDSGIAPIEMHPPLWFWSRNGFIFKI